MSKITLHIIICSDGHIVNTPGFNWEDWIPHPLTVDIIHQFLEGLWAYPPHGSKNIRDVIPGEEW
jgi:hypothetical protein